MSKKHIEIDEHTCYGCTACMNVCPKSAISMVENSEGFLFPKVDEKKCINCGLCKKICPIESSNNQLQKKQIFFAAQSKNDEVLMESSSGGMFYELSNYILKNDGYVCGAIFDENFKVKHIMSNNYIDVKKMMGSKYVQSELNKIFTKIKKELDNNKTVLFTGTPCQVIGLKKFLIKDYSKLITVDLICHGTPSQKIFDNYLKQIDKKIIDYKFRDKRKNGWSFSGSYSYKKNNRVHERRTFSNSDSYLNLYLNNYIYRKCCYNCQFANINRVSDITIGDCWNVKNLEQFFDTKKGVSLVIINSQKGKDIFDIIKEGLKTKKINVEDIDKKNNNLFSPTGNVDGRENIYNVMEKSGYQQIIKDNCKFDFFVPFVKRITPSFIKKILKKMR